MTLHVALSRQTRPRNYLTQMIITCIILVLFTSVGCDELNKLLGEDCDESADVLDEILQTEGQLTTDLPEEGPYPMSMIVSQDALNRLFSDISGDGLDPIELSVGDILGYDVSVKISPDIPLIQIEDVEDCAVDAQPLMVLVPARDHPCVNGPQMVQL